MRVFVSLAFVTCLSVSSIASAQVREGDVRLFLDTSFLRWTSSRAKGETRIGGDDWKQIDNTLEVDMLGRGGIGIGYVIDPYLVPELYFSLAHAKTKSKVVVDGDERERGESVFRLWELRPMLEIPLVPNGRAVPFLAAGFSLERQIREVGDGDTSRFAYGPYLGFGLHGFVRPDVSFDFGLGFRALFVKDEDREDALEVALEDVRQRQIDLMLTFGTSFWI